MQYLSIKKIMKQFFVITLLFLALASYAQDGRQNTPLFNLNGGNYVNKGWFISPGFTYMFPSTANRSVFQLQDNKEDTLYAGDYKSRGKFGINFEIGKFHLYDRKFIKAIDYGLGFKSLKGRESFDGLVGVDSLLSPLAYEANFKNSFVTGFFNITNFLQLSDRTFLQNSLGVNADYRLINKTDVIPDYGSQATFPKAFVGQLHYKFGFGFRAGTNLFVVPSIETPILGLYQWRDGKSTMHYFNSEYRPLIVSVRFFWLKKRPVRDCVGAPDKKTGDQLWGKDMRGKGKKRGKRRRKKAK